MHSKGHLKNTKLVQRSLIFIGSLIIIVAFSVFHGISGGAESTKILDQMLATGKLTGKFWRIIEVKPGRITVTKYRKIVTLIYKSTQQVRKGDNISFIAKSNGHTDPNGDLLWNPAKMRIHGKSSFKFYLSFISVLIVLIICLRSIQFDKRTISLTFRNGQY
jgi:hypothetical protein